MRRLRIKSPQLWPAKIRAKKSVESLEELRKQMFIILANLEMALDGLRSREIFEALEFDEPEESRSEKDGVAYYAERPVRVLYVKIPEMPLSLNGGFLEKRYAGDRRVWLALRRWWIIKIKRALGDWYGVFEPFSRCVVFGRFNFNASGKWDLDNFATKFLVDALRDARVIAEDHAGNLPAHFWMAQKSGTASVELLVLEGSEGLELFQEFWEKHYITCLQNRKKAPDIDRYGSVGDDLFHELGKFEGPIKIIPNKPGGP